MKFVRDILTAIDIDSDDENDNDDEDEDDINANTKDGGDVEDDNTLHPRTVSNKGNEEREEESLFSEDSDDGHDEHESESSDNKSKKKKKSRRTLKKTHWSDNGLPAAQEAATVLVAIGATRNVASFMVADGLDEITEIQ